jgi:hypothetical protein
MHQAARFDREQGRAGGLHPEGQCVADRTLDRTPSLLLILQLSTPPTYGLRSRELASAAVAFADVGAWRREPGQRPGPMARDDLRSRGQSGRMIQSDCALIFQTCLVHLRFRPSRSCWTRSPPSEKS